MLQSCPVYSTHSLVKYIIYVYLYIIQYLGTKNAVLSDAADNINDGDMTILGNSAFQQFYSFVLYAHNYAHMLRFVLF